MSEIPPDSKATDSERVETVAMAVESTMNEFEVGMIIDPNTLPPEACKPANFKEIVKPPSGDS